MKTKSTTNPKLDWRKEKMEMEKLPGSVELDESSSVMTNLVVEVILSEHNDVVCYDGWE